MALFNLCKNWQELSEIQETQRNDNFGFSNIKQLKHGCACQGFAPSKADESMMRESYKDGMTLGDVQDWMEDIKHGEDQPNYLLSLMEHFDKEVG